MKEKYLMLVLLVGLLISWTGCSRYTTPQTQTTKSFKGYINLKPVDNKILANGKEYSLLLGHTIEGKPVRFITDNDEISQKAKNHHKDSSVVLEGTPSLPFDKKTLRKIENQIKEKFGNDGIVVVWVYNWGMEHKCGETPCIMNTDQYYPDQNYPQQPPPTKKRP